MILSPVQKGAARALSALLPILAAWLMMAAPAAAATLGNDPAAGGILDGWSAIMVVNESDTYTNDTATAQTLTLTDFHFHAGASRGRVTPFVVRVNGRHDFTVLAIGRTRVAADDYPVPGVQRMAFDAFPVAIVLPPGATIAAGFTDAAPDGTGNGGSVIPYVDGGDSLWLTGGGVPDAAGRVAVGSAPIPGASTYETLARNYAFTVGFTTGPAEPPEPPGPAQLVLSEFVATNDGGLRDDDGSREDWIELHNAGGAPVDLLGWRLTDDPQNLSRWVFPARTLAPGAYLIVFASGKDRAPATGTLHANFRLDGSRGDFLALVRPDGTVADAMEPRPQFSDLAYGRGSNGGTHGYLTPTPNAANGPSFPFGLNEVAFSVPRGFLTGPQTLALTASVPGSVIRYTLNGTRPTATNGLTYEAPIPLTPDTAGSTRGTRRLRATALHPEAAATRIATHTWLFINGVTGPATDGVVGQTNSNNSSQTNAIKNNPSYGPLLHDSLTAVPAVCLTTTSSQPGTTETAASVEFFHPQGTEPGFQIDCGIQAVGNHSLGSPKNNFRLYFRSRYGQPQLRHNIFRGHPYTAFHQPAERFDRIALRSGSHDSFFWMADPSTPPMNGFKGDALYLRAALMDDFHLNMGHLAPHNRFVQLWLNGRYHGLYHWREYPDDDFMASYRPGSTGDFDFTNGANTGENGSATWPATWSKIRTAIASGHAEAARWIDLPQFADFMVLNFWAGNAWDWNPNQNWMAAGPKLPDRGGWNFFSYDNDVIWNDLNANLTIPASPHYVNNPRPGIMPPDGLMVTTPTNDVTLMDDPEFRILFRDRFYKACYHGGPLDTARAQSIVDFRFREISLPLVAETARWQPSAATRLPWDRDGEWMTEVTRIRNSFIPGRVAVVLAQIKARGWHPVDPPEFAQHGGAVAPGTRPTVTSTTADTEIWATFDGSDPRLTGGSVHPAAVRVTDPPPDLFAVHGPTRIRLRARRTTDGEWSALNEAAFHVGTAVAASADSLVISEIHYHPDTTADPDAQEFLEFLNVGPQPIDLTGCHFTRGLDYVFPAGTVLASGQRLVVTASQFLNDTALANTGERLTLVQPDGTVIRDFSYDDALPWPAEADGSGPSLILMAADAAHATDAWHSHGLNWRASAVPGGTPGTADPGGYAAWKTVHGLTRDDDDSDADGLPALLEYATGSDPATSHTGQLPTIVATATGPELHLITDAALSGVALRVESSITLSAWVPESPAVVSRQRLGPVEKTVIALPPEAAGRYWRLRVTAAP